MGEFFPNQRYISDGEPELGIGILTDTTKGKVHIIFPLSEEVRLYATESAPLRRVVFKPGDTIVDIHGEQIIIEKIQLIDNLYMYSGNGRHISEAELGNISITHNVDDRLFTCDVDSIDKFALRRESLYHNYRRRISPVNGFVGGKIDLIPHQLYIANEVSSRYAPRVLLSDQVGLGKTIEACLILHRLLVSGRISRVLILVPESLVHQWFVEVLRRFNLWFNIFDEDRCVSLEQSAPNGNPFLDNQLIICSTEFLAASEKRTQQAVSADWDMLVVDEAHHLEWSVDNISPEYKMVEQLSKIAKGLLLLTATPEQLGVESHFARLRLLDPNRYANYEDFIKESSDNKEVANIVEKLFLDKKLTAKNTKLLETVFSKDRIDLLAKGDKITSHNLVEDLLDQHGPGRVLFRNTRSAMSGFPKRIANIIPLKDADNQLRWISKLNEEFKYDLELDATANNKQFIASKDPRLNWIIDKMESVFPEKLLLICSTKEKVLALESALKRFANSKVGVFHEELTLIQRDRNSAWFADNENAQILLCSEIGSEGRNFQFAHHLILFDVPINPELLEQRIGRLDRIGQNQDINIHIPYIVGSPQQMIIKWFHEGLNAFNTNLEGGNEISKLFKDRLIDICKIESFEEATKELEALISETAKFQKELKKILAQGRDKLLEMNSFRPEVAKKLVSQIQSEDSDKTLEKYLTKVFYHFDIEMEDRASRTYLLHPTSTNTAVFPSIPQEGIHISFDRKRALSREDVSFISWDHPMTTGALDMVLSSTFGNASFGLIRGTGSPALVLELIFVLETAGKHNEYVDRFLPNTPLRIVVDHSGNDVTDSYPVEMLNKKLLPSKIDALLENDALVDTMLPNMISGATSIAEEQGAKEISNGLKRMESSLDHEINRLKALHKMNKHIRPDEINIARKERAKMTTIINNARIRLDALLLIRKE